MSIRNHFRSNAVGYLAIFLFAIGGTAYATHGAPDTISTEDIINGEVKTKDLKNDGATGTDIDEASLNFLCPEGTTEAGDICFGAVQGGADWETAADACASASTRLPSDGEARLVHAELGVPGADRGFWTGDQTSGTTAMISKMDTSGVTSAVDAGKVGSIQYVCVEDAVS